VSCVVISWPCVRNLNAVLNVNQASREEVAGLEESKRGLEQTNYQLRFHLAQLVSNTSNHLTPASRDGDVW
jgi:hypothetical protein